jgi:hypothetical protein
MARGTSGKKHGTHHIRRMRPFTENPQKTPYSRTENQQRRALRFAARRLL